jgi:D-3-phosphoglycerate dehydrogenase
LRTVVVGDHFIPAEYYVDALRQVCGPDYGPVTTVEWAGDKAGQHEAQQRMEWDGPEAVPVPAEIVAAVADAEVLAVHYAPVPKAVLAAAPRLKAVVVARAGLENVDREAARERGIEVFGVAGRNASAVAELTIGLMLSEARDIARADASVKAGGWRKEFPSPGREIGSSTVGLVGFGHVGRQLAGKLSGFGPRLLVHDPFVYDEELAEFGAQRAELPELFAESDFLSLQARVTPENERFIGAELLAMMKPAAYFVNVGRSRLVDYDDLYRVLAEGRIAGAALDVYDEEPLPVDSPWRKLDNVTLTPHYAGDTLDANRTSVRLVAERIASL